MWDKEEGEGGEATRSIRGSWSPGGWLQGCVAPPPKDLSPKWLPVAQVAL